MDDRARATRILERYCRSYFDASLRQLLGDICLRDDELVAVLDFDHNCIVDLDRTLVMTYMANYLERTEVQAHER